jgi:hypothetical protein
MPRYSFDFRGIDSVIKQLGSGAARDLERAIDDDLHDGIKEMARISFNNAPVETGALKTSILNSVRRIGRNHYMYGSHLPYAQRQEYEHRSKRFYLRDSFVRTAPKIADNIRDTIRSNLG